jgi:tryptophan synthase alpha chain
MPLRPQANLPLFLQRDFRSRARSAIHRGVQINRIDQTFQRLKAEKRAGFIAYITAGDPNLAATREIVLALEQAGADLVELGVPFSDPLADGVVNQMAAQRALEAGTTLPGILDCIRDLRKKTQIPIVLFTYLNPIYMYGYDRFQREAVEAGVDGVLILDLPPDESAAHAELKDHGALYQIRLIAPTTPPDRAAQLVQTARGFIYYVSREGVTGEQQKLAAGIAEHVAELKKHTSLPIAVGFGISKPEQASAIAHSADAVIVGSAIVRRIAEKGNSPDLADSIKDFVSPLVAATKEKAS